MEADDEHQCFKMNESRIAKKEITSLSGSGRTNKMFKFATTLLLALHMITQLTLATMSLPGGIENILGFVPKSTFVCERDGYFGDIDNDCRIFHLCQRNLLPNGRTEWRHWTYACGNQTMFNQLTLTCAFVDEAIPCRHASQFQYLNEVIHKPKEPFLTDADVTSGISYYSNRVMSDGARARAFEDSSLMAQIGGQAAAASIAASNQAAQNSFINQPAFSDDDLSSSRAVNSIETPVELFQPAVVTSQRIPQKRQQFQQQQQQQQPQQQLRQQFQQIQPLVLPPLTDPNAEVIINHQHNFQHTNNQPAIATQHQFAPIQHQFNRFQEQPAVQQAQIRTAQARTIAQPAETVSRIFAEPRQDNQETLAQARAQPQTPLPQVQPIDSTPKSFEFSIATDHRQGPALENNQQLNLPALDPSSFTFPLSNQQQFAPLATRPTIPATTTIAQPQFAPVSTVPSQTNPSPATILPPSKLADLQPNFGSPDPTTPVAISGSEAPTATTTAAAVTASTANDFLLNTQPATELTSSPVSTTFVAPTTPIIQRAPLLQPVTTPAAPSIQETRKPLALRATNQLTARQQRNLQNDLVFDRLHSSFQSTRLSAQSAARQQDSARPRRSESALVMRRQPLETISSAETSLPEGSQLSGGQEAKMVNQRAAVFDSGDFWRRPFDMYFLAPRFEHMLTRRRV